MAMSAEEIQRLIRERETLRGLLTEAENGHTVAPSYDGIPPDAVDASIQATRAKLARIEQLLAEQGGVGLNPAQPRRPAQMGSTAMSKCSTASRRPSFS